MRFKYKPGDIFGQLTITEYSHRDRKSNKTFWLCTCSCGIQRRVASSDLNKTRSCGCRVNYTIGFDYIPGQWYGCLKRSAKRRGIILEITIEECNQLLIKQDYQCALTHLPIKIDTAKKNGIRGETTASLDRINSNLGYTLNNCQFLHKHVNYMKQSFSQEYFIKLCKLIAEKYSKIPITKINNLGIIY